MRSPLIAVSIIGLVFVCIACASVPLADPSRDTAAKSFAVPRGKSAIYVIRDGGWISGSYQVFRVTLNRQDYGTLADGTYFVFIVDPGVHIVRAAGNENQERVELETKVDGLYFVSIRSSIGMANARVNVSLMSEQEGRAAVQAARLAASD
jgi:hypothetical protein